MFISGSVQKDQAANKSRSPRAAKPLIYIVDDEPMVLELAATLLEPLNCRIETFLDAETALAAFVEARPRPDLIITDFAMHRMNGVEFMQECRRLQPRQKIILTSGTVDESVYRNSPVRPDQFLAKPYQARQFIQLVESVLDAARG